MVDLEYRHFCITENCHVLVWNSLQCPNDPDHELDNNLTTVVNRREPNE